MRLASDILQVLDHGITCIDAGYIRPWLACFYLLGQEGEYALIETGTSRSLANLEAAMRMARVTPAQIRYVMPTHVHLDHAGGAGAMMARFPAARLVVHPRGARHMADPRRLVDSAREVYGAERFRELYGEIVPVPPERILVVEDGATVELGGRRLDIRHTPGHANHHYCIWDETSRGWFSGDSFGISYPWFRFPGGAYLLPTTTPTQFDPEALLQTFSLLDSYGPRRIFLTHSGELGYEPRLIQLLSRQVGEYCRLAAVHSSDLPDLCRALVDYSLREMQAFAPPFSERELRDLLLFDADLNAQGLAVWQRAQAGAG
jgi:glyoxylase-like metal-dependent hydrolase (beta-lactamase superfamily II)